MDQIVERPKQSFAGDASPSAEAYFSHFQRGATLEEVASLSGRTLGTVCRYLCAFIEKERPTSVDPWVPRDIQRRVVEAAKKHGTTFLRPIFVELEEKISYEMIRIVLSFMVV